MIKYNIDKLEINGTLLVLSGWVNCHEDKACMIINIDGTGNRVASTIYGHEVLYLVVGINKIAPDYDQALWRARNIAAPLNAKRLGCKTPCVTAGHCCDCASPDRICRALSVLWCKPGGIGRAEVVLVNEELGL